MTDYIITFDGGSKNNGASDAYGYGSYQIKTRTGKSVIERLEFELGTTNNEAEYRALIGGLDDLVNRIFAFHGTPNNFTVEIVGDSQLVLNHLQRTWRCKAQNLRPLFLEADALISQFQDVSFIWKERSHSVEVLGH